MNAGDQSAFRRWLALNMIVGACLLTVIAAAGIYSGTEATLTAKAQDKVIQQPAQEAEAR
jgi:hypothetical protein